MSWESVADDEQEKSADENARAAKQRLAALVLITRTADAVGAPAMAQDLTGASRETHIAIKEILGIADVLPMCRVTHRCRLPRRTAEQDMIMNEWAGDWDWGRRRRSNRPLRSAT